MAEVEIRDTCRCGAVFHVSGLALFIGFRHEAWLAAHESCRAGATP